MKRFKLIQQVACVLTAVALGGGASVLLAQESSTNPDIQLVQAKKKKGKAAARPANAPKQKGNVRVIDLPTVLQLAGAKSLDVQLAREQLTEAKAKHEIARERFFPWIMPGFAYRRHDGQLQDVTGNLFSTSKQSYGVGANVSAEWNLGEAIYADLAEKQRSRAADSQVKVTAQTTIYQAVQEYFEIGRAHV